MSSMLLERLRFGNSTLQSANYDKRPEAGATPSGANQGALNAGSTCQQSSETFLTQVTQVTQVSDLSGSKMSKRFKDIQSAYGHTISH